MTIIENTSDRLLLRDAFGAYGFHAFHKIGFVWILAPFVLLAAWFELSLNDPRLWLASAIILLTGLMSLTIWSWKLEIDVTKKGLHIRERLLWRRNREQTIPLQSVKEAVFRCRGLRRELVIIGKPTQEYVIASGIFEETLRSCATAINTFLNNDSPKSTQRLC